MLVGMWRSKLLDRHIKYRRRYLEMAKKMDAFRVSKRIPGISGQSKLRKGKLPKTIGLKAKSPLLEKAGKKLFK